jgi:hypothetical protein
MSGSPLARSNWPVKTAANENGLFGLEFKVDGKVVYRQLPTIMTVNAVESFIDTAI